MRTSKQIGESLSLDDNLELLVLELNSGRVVLGVRAIGKSSGERMTVQCLPRTPKRSSGYFLFPRANGRILKLSRGLGDKLRANEHVVVTVTGVNCKSVDFSVYIREHDEDASDV